MNTDREHVRVERNERGTPFLIYPDGDDFGNVGEGRREATVAEAHFYDALIAERALREQAEQERDDAESRAEKWHSAWVKSADHYEARVAELEKELGR